MATSQVKKMLSGLQELLKDSPTSQIYVAIAAILFTTLLVIVLFLKNASGTKRNSILFLGLCDAGKTLLFSLMVEKRRTMTHTSIRENKGKYNLKVEKNEKSLDILDLPGHERVRGQYIRKYEENTRGIVYLIDSATFPRQVRDIAEFLYDVIASKTWQKLKPAILVACNKQDLPTAKSCTVIKNQLEKELNTLRTTRMAALKGTDDSSSPENVDIGKKGKDFSFSNMAAKVDFIECQLKEGGDTGNLASIENWIKKVI